jgi:GTP-binding protein
MRQIKSGVRFEYEITTANLIGYRSDLLTATSGEGILHSTFLNYQPMSNRSEVSRGGAIVSQEEGNTTAYSLEKSQQHGTMLVGPGEAVYSGQVVGINNRSEDIVMNVVRGKKLTNMRASSADMMVVLTPPWRPSLERFLTLIGEDETLEVTPKSMRLRKKDARRLLKH